MLISFVTFVFLHGGGNMIVGMAWSEGFNGFKKSCEEFVVMLGSGVLILRFGDLVV